VIETDYLVIGSGLAGLYFALRAAEHGRVIVATKRAPADANTAYAQGGVAGALDPDDTVATHVDDTLRVGDGLCHRDVVESCAREAPEHILWFANELGVPFDRDAQGQLALGREGGHTNRRIVHAKDTTGWAIQDALLAGVARRADRITMLPDHMAIDLLTTAKYGGPNAVFGAYLLDQATGAVEAVVTRPRSRS
jgi:L-aspartate oxidase